MGSTEFLLATAVFARSIKVSGWQPGAPKSREHDFPKKKCTDFFEIHRTSETSMGSAALRKHAYGLHGTFCWPEQCLQGQLKYLDGSQWPQNPWSTNFRKKNVLIFLKFIGPVTSLWVL